ncbi:MAG: HAMP domain-containing protein [Lachnospiraceae bacterium]|jgi:methyl-accepting chemotaxis protein|nr:HAMP domain-containing protein [Lachnospiraceae bacterium]
MKNLKLVKKFVVTFGTILILFLVSVIATCTGISLSKKGYQRMYTEEIQSVTKVYEIQLNLQTALRELMMAANTENQQERATRLDRVNTYMTDLEDGLNWLYTNYEGDLTLFRQFESDMLANKSVRQSVMDACSLGTEAGDEQAIQLIMNDYGPVVEQYMGVLEQGFSSLTAETAAGYEQQLFNLNALLAIGIAIAAIAFLITLFIAVRLSKNIALPVRLIEDSMKEVVKGNLSVTVDYEAADEFGSMADSMRRVTSEISTIIKDIETILCGMADGDFTVTSSASELYKGDYQKIFHAMKMIKDNFNETLSTLNRSADQVSSGSDQVSSGAQALSQGATEQASSVEELAASINEISTHINQNSQSALEASTKSTQVGMKAGESNERMQDMLKAMGDINDSSGEIGKIIKTIEDIAFQTNILALNAAVEAARAGAAGKGFAVVADEVRNLASKSAEASKNTAALIENSLQAVENGKKIADETAQSLEVVISDIQEASSMMDTIAKASREQAEAISQITVGIDQISSVVQTNSATAEESAAASEELSGQAQILKDLVRKFKLEGDNSTVQYQPSPSYSGGYDDVMPGISYGGDDKY